MDTALVKFIMLWILFENVVFTTSMALKGMANKDANTRQKRSPANNFSLFGFNPVSTARESFSSIGNIFSGDRGNRHQNNYQEQIDVASPYGNMRNTNTLFSVDFPSRSDIPNSMAQNDFQREDSYVFAQDNKTEVGKKTVPVRKQTPNIETVPERNNEAIKNAGYHPNNGEIDKNLIQFIFQKPQFNNDAADTTVDNNIDDFVTETGEYTTTIDPLADRILPEAVAASLLG